VTALEKLQADVSALHDDVETIGPRIMAAQQQIADCLQQLGTLILLGQ
jgi:hypothetical protein